MAFGWLSFCVPGGEHVVPEERELFFQRAPGVDHPVEPVCLAALHVNEAVLVDVIAPDEVFIFKSGRRVLRVKQFLNRCLVALRSVFFDFLPACSESGAAKKVRHQREITVRHGTLLILSQVKRSDEPHYTERSWMAQPNSRIRPTVAPKASPSGQGNTSAP